MIKVRGGFSERIGKPTCAVTIQLDEFDDRTRIFISNLLFDFLQITFQNDAQFRKQPYGNTPVPLSSDFCKNLGQDVFSFRNHLQGGYFQRVKSCLPWLSGATFLLMATIAIRFSSSTRKFLIPPARFPAPAKPVKMFWHGSANISWVVGIWHLNRKSSWLENSIILKNPLVGEIMAISTHRWQTVKLTICHL